MIEIKNDGVAGVAWSRMEITADPDAISKVNNNAGLRFKIAGYTKDVVVGPVNALKLADALRAWVATQVSAVPSTFVGEL